MMKDWLELARESVLDPRAAAPRLMSATLPEQVPGLMLALLAVLNGGLYALILPRTMQVAPLVTALLAGAIIWTSAWLLTAIGTRMGGQGGFAALLRVVLWLQVLRLAAQLAVLLLSALIPVAGPVAGLAVGAWGIYMMTCFVAEAHGFDTRLKALGLLGAVFVITLLGASVVASVMGGGPALPG